MTTPNIVFVAEWFAGRAGFNFFGDKAFVSLGKKFTLIAEVHVI